MLKVDFYDTIEDSLLSYAVIVSRFNGQWVFCKHKKRNSFEIPGGKREIKELINDTATRELWEETGALYYTIQPVCVYGVSKNNKEDYGMLYYAEIFDFGLLPDMEIEETVLFDKLPTNWTYPLIQPLLLEKVNNFIQNKK